MVIPVALLLPAPVVQEKRVDDALPRLRRHTCTVCVVEDVVHEIVLLHLPYFLRVQGLGEAVMVGPGGGGAMVAVTERTASGVLPATSDSLHVGVW